MKWIKDLKAEHCAKSMGVEFVIETWPLKKILIKEGRDNQIRLGRKISDFKMQQYASRMNQGYAFEMAWIFDMDGKGLPASGNHRIGAAEINEEHEIPFYVVRTTDKFILDQLPRRLNVGVGDQSTREESLMAAYEAVCMGSSRKDAAADYNLSESSLGEYIRKLEVNDKLKDQNIEGGALLQSEVLKRLSPIMDRNENVFFAAGRTLSTGRWLPQEAVSFLESVGKFKDEKSAIEFCEEKMRVVSSRKGGIVSKKGTAIRNISRLRVAITNIEKVCGEEHASFEKSGITEKIEQETIAAKLRKSIKYINTFLRRSGFNLENNNLFNGKETGKPHSKRRKASFPK